MNYRLFIVLSLMLGSFLFLMELLIGSVSIPAGEVLAILTGNGSINRSWEIIILDSRLPRALTAVVAGAGLSVSGLFMQTLFRNPLAGPHILGISAGSSLGVAIALMTAGGLFSAFLSNVIIVFAAFLGAMMVLSILFLVSLKYKDVLTVLIFGILIGAISLAIVSILQYLSSADQLKAFLIWTLGSFDGIAMDEALFLSLISFPIILFSISFIKPLNAMLAGEEYARLFGVNVIRKRMGIMVLAGGLTALATAFCGPIGFVGVVVPHFCRMLLRTYDHFRLIPASVLVGVNLMLFSDLMAHLPLSNAILPINSITSLIGIPFIFWMLWKGKNIVRI